MGFVKFSEMPFCYRRKEKIVMGKWLRIFLALVVLGVFSFGCAGVARDTKVKCPKCGAIFTVDEGVTMYGGGGGK